MSKIIFKMGKKNVKISDKTVSNVKSIETNVKNNKKYPN